ncbi:hypothetical protein Taro_005124 [Colocasia esculenta]|uniref:Patellin-3 n=1 Tax=Colocasia esculenta TaxID=4460 RepID=A0A843TTN0_COLES|nr:hypothetical protein [Colocasia esculenta]
MAEDTQTPAPEAPAAAAAPAAAVAADVVVTPAEEEKAAVEQAAPAPPPPAPEAEEEAKKPEAAAEGEKEEESAIAQSASFKEESNVVAELEDPQKKALDELKQLVQASLANNEFTRPPPPPPAAPKEEEKAAETAEAAAEAPKDEEPKAEEAAAEPPKAEEAAAEPSKAEETAAEPPKAVETAAEAPSKVEEAAPVVETKEVEAPKAEEPAPPAADEPAVAVVTVTEEKAIVVDEDGAKTVEAIAETVVSVAVVDEPPASESAEAPAPAEEEEKAAPEEVSLWGVPLLGDEKSDTVLLKFLRARDYKVKDALAMLKDAVIWRKEFGIEGLLEEDLGLPELEKVVFMHGHDKESHPVCYNVYGEFQDKDLYQKVFSDEEKRKNFLRWRIQFLEKGIRQLLDFTPSGVCSMVQVTDLRNSPVLGKKEFRQATKQALALLQDSYPEFVAKKIFINVPWWYLAYNRMISTIFTPRTKSKFVFAGPSKSSETLFKSVKDLHGYIAPEQVPVQYGGLSKENDSDFSTSDAVTEVTIKPSSKHSIEIPVSEVGLSLSLYPLAFSSTPLYNDPALLGLPLEQSCLFVWELRVLGWDVSYGAEFVPSAEDGYTVIVQKTRKFTPTDEPFVKNSFKIGDPGKIVLTVDNTTSKKKKLLYRSKTKIATDAI